MSQDYFEVRREMKDRAKRYHQKEMMRAILVQCACAVAMAVSLVSFMFLFMIVFPD